MRRTMLEYIVVPHSVADFVRRNRETIMELKAELYSYSQGLGLFAGVALEGAVLQSGMDTNNVLYGLDVNTDELFKGRAPHTSGSGRALVDTLNKYIGTKKDQPQGAPHE